MSASNTPKTMSSRLMTMKFMQRSAAKTTYSGLSTPNGPLSKRIRVSDVTPAPGPLYTPDHETIQAALAAEEKKRQNALDKAAAKAGETKWVLSFKDLQEISRPQAMSVAYAGFAAIDADDDESDEGEMKPVRMQFGGGVKKETSTATEGSGSDSDSKSESDDCDSEDATAALIRETKREAAPKSREARKTQKKEPPKRAPFKIDEDMDLGGLTSISGGLSSGGRGNNSMTCYNCGKQGHINRDCLQPKAPRGSAGRGRGRGRR
ncbi:uncharacterized protein BDR25DRAFT_306834 [Lindgomyces ingoldianus]|uniref:Uncharacterized protein n=1 Tax=Lindgomyces ingoldianus TaxID=673940 RepID=A0ACB6QDZ3_9PLEO|nr:uncharacterized protein BDR25DRAFT_306834 [Lindgomyces ingoldianus]KAF2465193.1 hypothetical protein BDR25DRAFT_306834 [Lindgomyces ingoldianus]